MATTAGTATTWRTPTVAWSLRNDLARYLHERGRTDHFSALSLRVTYSGWRPDIAVSVGSARYGGFVPVSTGALWQIGSNTKAFTSAALLQLEAEGKLSIHDTLSRWLPQYPAWGDVTIAQLLSMTSGIPNYTNQDAFAKAFTSDPATAFTPQRLVSYVANLPLGPSTWAYSNTNYILAQMIIERATHDSYFDQITKRFIKPLGLHHTCFAPETCRPGTAARMPAGYFTQPAVPALLDKPVPPLALSWAQGAGGLVSSLADMTTWDRALYDGRLLPTTQQRELESLISTRTSRPITTVTPSDRKGYGLGVAERYDPVTGAVWAYEGATFGYRVLHMYLPRTGTIIAIAVNSSVRQDTLPDLADSVYQTLTAHQPHHQRHHRSVPAPLHGEEPVLLGNDGQPDGEPPCGHGDGRGDGEGSGEARIAVTTVTPQAPSSRANLASRRRMIRGTRLVPLTCPAP